MKHSRWIANVALMACALGVVTMKIRAADEKPTASGNRFFELRTYTAAEGKLEALHARFRDHTNALFVKHGVTLIGFWTPADEPRSKNTLIYILAYPDRESRKNPGKNSRTIRTGKPPRPSQRGTASSSIMSIRSS